MTPMGRIALVIIAALAVLAAACGNSDDGDNDSEATVDARQPGSVTAGTPGAVATDEHEGEDADAGATPDPVDPNVVSTVGLDADPATPEIDANGEVSGEFVIAYVIAELGAPMVGYQFDIEWDNSNIEFVSAEHLENGGLVLCPQTVDVEAQRILGACAQPQLVSTDYTGQVSHLTFRCTSSGEVTLHLNYQEGSFGTKIETYTPELQTSHSLELTDATVTCA